MRATRSTPSVVEDRLIEATLACLRRFGEEGTNISSIARMAGVSRPTVYTHGGDRERLVQQAVQRATLDLTARIIEVTERAATPAEAIVEFVVAAHREFQADPVVAMVVRISLLPGLDDSGVLTDEVLAIAGAPMRRVLESDPSALARIDEITEAMVRALLSFLTYRSTSTATDDALRAYLEATLVPIIPVADPATTHEGH